MMIPARRLPTFHVILAIGLIVTRGRGHADDGVADQSPRLILEALGRMEAATLGEGNVYAAKAVSCDRNSIVEVVIPPGQIEKLAGLMRSRP